MSKLKELMVNLRFARNLRIAKKKWSKVVASSPYYSMTKRERRSFIKEVLREIGYKRIRLIEKRPVQSEENKVIAYSGEIQTITKGDQNA